MKSTAPRGVNLAKKTGSENSPDTAGRLYVVLARLIRGLRRGAPLPVGHSSVSALAVIAEHGPLRIGDLAARESVSAPAMTRIVGALDTAGYTTREADRLDARASLISVTPEGRQFIHGTRSARSDELRSRLARLSPEQRRDLARALPALEQLARDELA